MPFIVSGYLQLLFNVAMLSLALYGVASFVSSIRHDVDMKVEQFSEEILSEIAICSRDYVENRCSPDTRIPAMQKTCEMWRRCMERDPTLVARSKLNAQTLGEIFNSFVEPLSYKAMIFFTVFVFGFMIASNVAFKLSRASMPSPADDGAGAGVGALNGVPKHGGVSVYLPGSAPALRRSRTQPAGRSWDESDDDVDDDAAHLDGVDAARGRRRTRRVARS